MFKRLMATAIFISASFCSQALFAQVHGQGTGEHFQFQDNKLSYIYGSTFREPWQLQRDAAGNALLNKSGEPIATNIDKNIIGFTHIDKGNKFGDNFFDVQYLMSNHLDPVGAYHGNFRVGAKDAYFIYHHELSLNRTFHTKAFTFGPVKDVLFSVGGEFNTKNSDFSAQRRSPEVGATFNLKYPKKGYWTVSTLWTKEWNEEGTDYLTIAMDTWGKPIVYDATWSLQTAWAYPFHIRKASFNFEGWGTVNGTKGKTGGTYVNTYSPAGIIFSEHASKPEEIILSKLMYNAGDLFGAHHQWMIGFVYQYWENKFGVDHHYNPGSQASTPMVEVDFHL